MDYPDSRWRPCCQGNSHDDVSDEYLIVVIIIIY